MMKTADEIEREIKKRFEDQIYVGMSNMDYLIALADVTIRYTAENLHAYQQYGSGDA